MGSNIVPFEIIKDRPIEILGKGLKYPFEIEPYDENYNGVQTSSDYYKIQQSIASILGTPIGSRFFNREFGSKLYLLKFEPNDEIFASTATFFIAESLYKWEKRITLNNVAYDMSPYMIDNYYVFISTYFTIIRTQVSGNYVFPFYRGVPPVHPDQGGF